ncbi:HYR domain-containing protein [Marininema mesophilum]|uniref:HYR domain-containing protein n=1 Tax=Marininema mesophilum TaxID=1048340 RepID=UPI0015A6CDEE|nr:HYR domain-containing protein [Marininema mesophilum]
MPPKLPLRDGLGGFAPQTTFAVGSGPVGITSADFNGDGTPDLATTDSGDNTVSVLLDSCVTPLTCTDLTLENNPGTCGATVPFPTPQCSNVSTVSDPATVPVGTPTLVTSTATSNVDSANIEACTFTVTVNDTEPPVISGLRDIDVEANNAIGTIVTYPDPTVTDNCPGTITTFCNPASGSFFPIGSTLVTCIAIDSNGNSATGTFTVTVFPFEEE